MNGSMHMNLKHTLVSLAAASALAPRLDPLLAHLLR